MKEIIKLHSRNGVKNYLERINETSEEKSKTYVLKTSVPTLRGGYVNGKQKFIDPAGGPMIVEGQLLKEAKAVVKSIDFIAGFGHTITFE